MKKLFFVAGLCALLLGFVSPARAQDDQAMAAIKQNFPQLFDLFKDEMQNQHANYLFAVDVSGTMNSNAPVVIPALKAFINSLPDGDYVDIIRFGDYAKSGDLGYAGTIDLSFKNSLCSSVDRLYSNTNDADIRHFTDIPKAMFAAIECLKNYSKEDLNFVFLLTDFRNEEKGKPAGPISKDDLRKIEDGLQANTLDKNVRVISLQLPFNPNWREFCRPQLDDIFNNLALDYKTIPVADETALRNWFDRLKKNVMYDRLQAIVSRANKEVKVDFDPKVSIDGNVTGVINWKPNKLYREIKVNDILVPDASGFKFKAGKELTAEPFQMESIELPLGKLKHQSWGFHKFDDSMKADIDLPTPFDNELAGLEIKKPVPDSQIPLKKLIFTFILPLWLTITILALLLIYIFMVIGAMKRNAKESFSGSIEVYKGRNFIYENDSIKKKNVVSIPGDLNARGTASVDWDMQLRKRPSNPFLFWKKPTYELIANTGYIQDGSKVKKAKKGMTPSFLKNKVMYCGIDSEHADAYSIEFRKRL
ncbi:MAG: VWA domain-containing protein [Bacteroidales bacterium]|nr:VWA domain-containing protein [Bacteroidales bacterium]